MGYSPEGCKELDMTEAKPLSTHVAGLYKELFTLKMHTDFVLYSTSSIMVGRNVFPQICPHHNP